MTRPTLTPISLAPLRKKVASILGCREVRVKSEVSVDADPIASVFVDVAAVEGRQVVQLNELAEKLKFSVRIQPDHASSVRIILSGRFQLCIYSDSPDVSL